MKISLFSITLILSISGMTQELGVNTFFSIPYKQTSWTKKIPKDERGELYKKSEYGFSIFYRNKLKPSSKWVFSSELSHSFDVKLSNNRNLNQSDIPNSGEVTDIVEVKTSKTVLSIGISREFFLTKLNFYLCPRLNISSKMFPSTDIIYEYPNGTLKLNFGTNRNLLKVNMGIDFRKKIKENLTLQLSIETDRFDIVHYASEEFYTNQVGNVTYQYFIKHNGKFNAHNIRASLGLSYKF